jgi:hypothetical protein
MSWLIVGLIYNLAATVCPLHARLIISSNSLQGLGMLRAVRCGQDTKLLAVTYFTGKNVATEEQGKTEMGNV